MKNPWLESTTSAPGPVLWRWSLHRLHWEWHRRGGALRGEGTLPMWRLSCGEWRANGTHSGKVGERIRKWRGRLVYVVHDCCYCIFCCLLHVVTILCFVRSCLFGLILFCKIVVWVWHVPGPVCRDFAQDRSRCLPCLADASWPQWVRRDSQTVIFPFLHYQK